MNIIALEGAAFDSPETVDRESEGCVLGSASLALCPVMKPTPAIKPATPPHPSFPRGQTVQEFNNPPKRIFTTENTEEDKRLIL